MSAYGPAFHSKFQSIDRRASLLVMTHRVVAIITDPIGGEEAARQLKDAGEGKRSSFA